MHITGKLIFKSYKPLRLERGMLFLVRQNKDMVIFQLTVMPIDVDAYLQLNGYPVDPYIILEGNKNLDEDYIIAYPHQIGWWDVGEQSDELYDITSKEINQILDNDCRVDIEVEDDEYDVRGFPIPLFIQDKAILSHPLEEENDDDDVEYFFDDDEEYLPPSSNDEWENQFTNPKNNLYDQD